MAMHRVFGNLNNKKSQVYVELFINIDCRHYCGYYGILNLYNYKS